MIKIIDCKEIKGSGNGEHLHCITIEYTFKIFWRKVTKKYFVIYDSKQGDHTIMHTDGGICRNETLKSDFNKLVNRTAVVKGRTYGRLVEEMSKEFGAKRNDKI